MRYLIALTTFGALLAGCATSHSPALYTLDTTPSAQAGSPVNITLGRLRIAESLLNKRILVKQSPTEIEYYATAQWAASLDELLREKLTAEFGPIDTARPSFDISGTLQAFEQVDTPSIPEAHVKLALEVRKAGESQYAPAALSKVYDVSLPVAEESAGGVVVALSTCLEQVARAIVADVVALQ